MAHDFEDIHMDLADMTHAFLGQQMKARYDNTLEAWGQARSIDSRLKSHIK